MRINKYLAERLGISRRKADDFLLEHEVSVNGTPVTTGQDITETDAVLVDGKPLGSAKKVTYVLLNKPVGYVCSRDGQGSQTIYDLLPPTFSHLNPVGRLDKDSSGLLLLTNDGHLHNELTHPSFQKEKIYSVTLNKPLTALDKAQIEKGVLLADGLSRLQLRRLQQDSKEWEVRMHEGRNRQIRRTFEALGYHISSLHRTQFGAFSLDQLASGEFKEISLDNSVTASSR